MTKIRMSETLAASEQRIHQTGTSGFLSLLKLWRRRMRRRRELSTLTARQMDDTGLDPAVIRRESQKPFWKA